MAWNPQGGGQGPWGGGGGPSGPQPPDIEEMLRKGQERFRRFMPGGMKTSRGILLIVVALAGIWLASGFYRVDAAQQGVVLLFGKHYKSSGPACIGFSHHRLPKFIRRTLKKCSARTSVFVAAQLRLVRKGTLTKKV